MGDFGTCRAHLCQRGFQIIGAQHDQGRACRATFQPTAGSSPLNVAVIRTVIHEFPAKGRSEEGLRFFQLGSGLLNVIDRQLCD